MHLAEILRQGQTQVRADIKEFVGTFGYSPNSVGDLMNNVKVLKLIREAGVMLETVRYKNTDILRDGRLALEETDLEAKKEQIDRQTDDRIQKSVQTNRALGNYVT